MTVIFGSSDQRVPPADVLRRLAISERGFVFDPVSGNSFTVNETGLEVLRRLQNSSDVQAIIQELLAEYATTPRELERDLMEFLGMLRDYFGTAP